MRWMRLGASCDAHSLSCVAIKFTPLICHYCFAHVSEEPDLPRQLQLRLQQVIRSQGLACHAVTID
jgi:hypothetical protein